jgi:glycosyltransferase involved in cell wall biosynthesis
MPRLFLLVPLYNDAAAFTALWPTLRAVLSDLQHITARVIVIDDGSKDETPVWTHAQCTHDAMLDYVRLSRNFGKEAALLAGFDAITPLLNDEDFVAVMDGDGQDPPAMLAALLATAQQGPADVVIAVRAQRRSESVFKRAMSRAFQALMRTFGDVAMPRGASDFCVLRANAARAIASVREVNRFFKGLTEWVGFRVATVPYDQAARLAGETKWRTGALSAYALRGLLAHSKAPLRAVTVLGLAMATLAFCYGGFILVRTMLFGDVVRGYPTLMVTILALGGVQLLGLGILGEYLGRALDEIRRRPVYVVAETSLPSSATRPIYENSAS